MEKIKQQAKAYKYQIIVALLAIALTVFYNWNNNKLQKLQGEYNILEKQYTAQKENVILLEEYRKKEKDSLNKAITSREEENKKLRLREKTLQDKIDVIKKRPFKLPTDLKEHIAYYNTQYKTAENKVVEDKVGLGLSTSTAIITDLEEGNKCEEIIPLKDEQLKNKDLEIVNLNKDKEDLSVLVSSAEKTIEAGKELQKSAEENIKNLEEQNKKLKTKSFLNKVLVPVALVVGGIIGVQVAK